MHKEIYNVRTIATVEEEELNSSSTVEGTIAQLSSTASYLLCSIVCDLFYRMNGRSVHIAINVSNWPFSASCDLEKRYIETTV